MRKRMIYETWDLDAILVLVNNIWWLNKHEADVSGHMYITWNVGYPSHIRYTDSNIQTIFTPTDAWWRHQWKHFPRHWPYVRGIHRRPVSYPHKGQWREALLVSLICVNNGEAADLRRHRAHYDVNVMYQHFCHWYDAVMKIARLLYLSNTTCILSHTN